MDNKIENRKLKFKKKKKKKKKNERNISNNLKIQQDRVFNKEKIKKIKMLKRLKC